MLDLVSTLHGIIFYVVGIALIAVLVKWHTDDGPFDFRNALLDTKTKQVSFAKLGNFICLVISTVIVCYETVNGRLSDWLFGAYMIAWTSNYVASKAVDQYYNKSSRELGE